MVSASKDNNMLVTIFLIIIFANIIKALFLRPKYGRNIRERFERWHWKKAAKSFGINERNHYLSRSFNNFYRRIILHHSGNSN